MSLLPVAALIAEYNRDKPSRFDLQCNYELTNEDRQAILKIMEAIRVSITPLLVEARVLENCKQIYLKCRERPEIPAAKKAERVSLPNIHRKKKKV